jgi:hypothetical protein
VVRGVCRVQRDDGAVMIRSGDTVVVRRTFADGRRAEWSGTVVSCSPIVSAMGGHGLHLIERNGGHVHLWIGSDAFASTTVADS